MAGYSNNSIFLIRLSVSSLYAKQWTQQWMMKALLNSQLLSRMTIIPSPRYYAGAAEATFDRSGHQL